MNEKIRQLKEIIDQTDNLVFFGGAGVSTESGIPDFRSTDGLYNMKYKYPPETIVSHTFFVRKTEEFYEFYKEKFLNKQSISNEIKEYLSNKNLNVYEILLFFIRMFYPSFYFDKYEYIINNEEDDYQLKNIIELSDKYEKLLKEIYFYLSKYINMPDIEWIKKT